MDVEKVVRENIESLVHMSLEDILEEAKRADGHQFYKITVENWYVFGRFGEASSQKYQLVWNGGKK